MFYSQDEPDGGIDIMKGLIAGVAGGLLASFLMEQFQAAWSAATEAIAPSQKRAGRRSDPATVKAANLLAEKVTGRKLPANYKPLGGEAVHYGMGAGSAAVYGVLAEVAPVVTVGDGAAFGTSIWLLADELAVPAAGLSKPAREIPITTHVYALASHLVYGWITETVRQAIRRAL
jgi:putative membrane protein